LKKIDLHIHTIPTVSDRGFSFSVDTFKRYVKDMRLDLVAVTNHDIFDAAQFRMIQGALEVLVLPGIEINLEKGHLLLIGNETDIDDFEAKARQVSLKVVKIGDYITVEQLQQIYGDLNRYLLIPHYEKGPPISGTVLEKLKPFICAGEVDSPKKFIRAIKDKTKLTPVLFSDSRMGDDLQRFPTRQTYIDCGVLSLNALKTCLRDKSKVALSEGDGNALWQAFDGGPMISTGLNVLIGARSSGKTHTLNQIHGGTKGTKYIKQFSLVQQNDDENEREFNGSVERRRGVFVDDYLSGLKRVLDEIMVVDVEANERAVAKYIETLLKSAEDADRQDVFSKAALFSEVEFPIEDTETLEALIGSVRQVIENQAYRSVIERHVDIAALKRLILELIEILRGKALESEKRKVANSVIRDVKQVLRVKTSAVQIEDVDLYRVSLDTKRVARFREIVTLLRREAVIFQEPIQAFRVEATRGPYLGAGEVKQASGVKTAFGDAFKKYEDPYAYLRELMKKGELNRADLYRFFVKIGYRILNKDGFEVSGGERSEFRLLQEINDSHNYDILLIDEPESSFDNPFLKSGVNQIIKDLSQTVPVVVVTHNNTVGASIGADYLIFTRKELDEGKVVYRIYAGHPTDKELRSIDGRTCRSHEILLDALEAGEVAYDERRRGYEAAKN
jgi:hypothetical protein